MIKADLKPKEVKFLEYYFGGDIALELAVKKAGDKSKDAQSRGIIGKMILVKYVSAAGTWGKNKTGPFYQTLYD